jgi:hypothetical protein
MPLGDAWLMQIVISLESGTPPEGVVEVRRDEGEIVLDAGPDRGSVPFRGWLELIRAIESVLGGALEGSGR